ncbi:nucleoside triphosphate pyrophosphohydrolase [Candidatus Berkelbacteria bacterium]|nr:nucleoside triphosphate pyrophosphohydrolase [Candidatus Berkelbacteria bacterium]
MAKFEGKEKLVRDRIPELIKARGGRCKFRIADENEAEGLLLHKLNEELVELADAKTDEDRKAEMGDVLDVVDELALRGLVNSSEIGKAIRLVAQISLRYGIDTAEIDKVRAKKTQTNGGFKKLVVLTAW